MAKLSKKVKEKIARGKELSVKIKKDETELEGIKNFLKAELDEGTHIGDEGSVAIISEKDVYAAPAPKTVLEKLKAIKKAELFPDCVKILVEATRKILGEGVYNEIRGSKTTVTSISFK